MTLPSRFLDSLLSTYLPLFLYSDILETMKYEQKQAAITATTRNPSTVIVVIVLVEADLISSNVVKQLFSCWPGRVFI